MSDSKPIEEQGFITRIREKYRYKDIALFDLVGSFIVIIIIFLILQNRGILKTSPLTAAFIGALATMPISIAAHVIFGVNTTVNYRLGLSGPPERPKKT